MYRDVLARNLRAARSRRGISQQSLAARMRALGYDAWLHQTVGSVEKGKRRVTGEEIFALSYALETSVAALMMPTEDDKGVEFPSGHPVGVRAARHSVIGYPDTSVRWTEDSPEFGDPGRIFRPDIHGNDLLTPEPLLPGFASARTADHPIPLEETLEQPVVAAIVTSELGVLIGRRNDGKPPWTFIAGEVEPGESPADAAVREVKEETGCEVAAGQAIGERVHPKTGRTMIYMAGRPIRGTDVFVGDSEELAEVRWVRLAEADELLPGMFEQVREYLAATIG